MNNKTLLLFLLFLVFAFVPNVYANEINVTLKSIEKVSTTGNALEAHEPSISGSIINLDFRFIYVGDSITYKITFDNKDDEEYNLLLNSDSDNILYSLSNNIIDKNAITEITLVAKYNAEVSDEQKGQSIKESIKVSVIDNNGNIVNTVLTNPKTGRNVFFLFIILFLLLISLFVIHNKKIKPMIILFIVILIPVSVYAVNSLLLTIESNIVVYDMNQKVYYWAPGEDDPNGFISFFDVKRKFTADHLDEIPKNYYIETTTVPTIAENDIYEIQDESSNVPYYSSEREVMFNSLETCNNNVDNYTQSGNGVCTIKYKKGEVYDKLEHKVCLRYNNNILCLDPKSSSTYTYSDYRTMLEDFGLICMYTTETNSAYPNYPTSDVNSAVMMVCTTNQNACSSNTSGCRNSWYDRTHYQVQIIIYPTYHDFDIRLGSYTSYNFCRTSFYSGICYNYST